MSFIDLDLMPEFFTSTVTLEDETASGFDVVGGMENIPCHREPALARTQVDPYETAREYTDVITMKGYYPRAHSGLIATVTEPGGEQVTYIVHDVEHSPMNTKTSLLCRRRGLDS